MFDVRAVADEMEWGRQTDNEARTRPPRAQAESRFARMSLTLRHTPQRRRSYWRRSSVGVLVLGLCLAPRATGFLVAESMLTQCFGIANRPTRTASSCSLVVPRSQNAQAPNTEEHFTFFTHDGRTITVAPWDEKGDAHANTAGTFTFYTHDGRAVTARERLSTPSGAGKHWTPTGVAQQNSDELAHLILRSRYPSYSSSAAGYSAYNRALTHTSAVASLSRSARLAYAGGYGLGEMGWVAVDGKGEGAEVDGGNSEGGWQGFFVDKKMVEVARAQFEKLLRQEESVTVSMCRAAYVKRMKHLAHRASAARKFTLHTYPLSDSSALPAAAECLITLVQILKSQPPKTFYMY